MYLNSIKRTMIDLINRIVGFMIWSGKNKTRPAYIRYGLPIILVVATTIIKLQFNDFIGNNSPYLLYFGIICLSAIIGGMGPALLASLISGIIADYYFIYPYSDFSLTPKDLTETGIFLFESFLLILLSSSVRFAYEQVHRSQLLFKAMIEKASEGIILTDNNGKRIYCSPSIERIIGYTPEEFAVMEPWLLADPEEIPWMENKMKELRDNPGTNISFVHRMRHKDGRWLWIENSVTNLLNDEAVKAVVANFHNVTERVTLEQKKDDFISIASHELKTPITSLKASLQLLDKMKDAPTSMFGKLIEQSNRSMDKVNVLVDELLNASRVKQGHLHLNKSKFNLASLVDGCCNNISIAGKSHLVFKGDKQLDIVADENRVEQVIINFITNAVKYAPNSKEIQLIVEREGDLARVSVKDDGPGIPEESLPRLFDRYYRAENTEMQNPGLGLGLYISAGIIKRHNGEIGAISALGKGSTFWFTLPVNG